MLPIPLVLVTLLSCQPDSIPYKPDNEYTLKFDLKLKTEITATNKFDATNGFGTKRPESKQANLPYLTLLFQSTVLANNERRLRVLRGNEAYINRKLKVNELIKLELGFSDDIKDKIVPNEYTLYLLNEKKEPVSRIVIFFDDEGYYFVNNQQRGKI